MRIGVITFCTSADNYGQMLQCYALQHFLRCEGHDAFLIRYEKRASEAPQASFRAGGVLRYVLHAPQYLALLREMRVRRLYDATADNAKRAFGSFMADNVVATEHVYDEQELLHNPPQADAYVCGSDQIWGGDFAYYLNFAPDGTKKIAYAASFGGVNSFAPGYEAELKRLLGRFQFLGIREQSGVETCNRLGFADARKVVDPTLLLTAADYDAIRSPLSPAPSRQYVFLYLLGNKTDLRVKQVYDYARCRGMDVVYVASQGQYDSYPKTWATVGEWIDGVAGASLVVTNSFHCTVFAMIYGRPFVTVPLSGGYERMNTRVQELLEATKLENRLYGRSIDAVADEPIYFSAVADYQSEICSRDAELLLNQLK